MMKKSDKPENTETGYSPFSIFHSPLLPILGTVVYLLFFFAAPFEPYRSPEGDAPSRAFFFSYLLLPDEYFSSWLGPDGTVSLWDRLPILLTVGLGLFGASGIGLFLLTVSGVARRLTNFETHLFSLVVGLGVGSHAMFYFAWRGDAADTPGIRLMTGGAVNMAWFLYALRAYWEGREPPDTPAQVRNINGETTNCVRWLKFIWVLPVFGVLLILGGMIPSTDYDVLSYHLAGTRSFFEAGRIDFVPNNVYANMPFGAEMFFLWGMALTGSVFHGAMVGKTIIAATTIITALGIYAFGRRFFSETTGLVGMFLYMTTPWIFYVSTVGLVDTVVGMYAFFAIYAASLYVESRSILDRPLNWAFLTGFFAGSAAACKYPAMLFVVFPLFIFIAIKSRGRSAAQSPDLASLLIFILAVLLSCAGWHVKNWYYTGNPVYPLCFSIFGDTTGTWTPEIDARWTDHHSPHGFGPVRFWHDFLSVGLTSPWNGPLMVPFALLGVWCTWRAKTQAKNLVVALIVWLAFFFGAWWLLTHRIDRFWLPALPVLCVLAGLGATWTTDLRWKRTLAALLVIATVYGFLACGAPAPGKMNRCLASLDSMRKDPAVSTPWAVWFNANPPDGRILLLGEAKAFLYDVPVLYGSCWNETSLKAIVESGDAAGEFRNRNIAFVLVDWSEIRRFRSPGNYGYSEFVVQEVFDRLVADGILERFVPDEKLAESPTVVYRVLGEKKE